METIDIRLKLDVRNNYGPGAFDDMDVRDLLESQIELVLGAYFKARVEAEMVPIVSGQHWPDDPQSDIEPLWYRNIERSNA